MILAIASQKGGTGKTTTSISLAAGIAHLGHRTLLIDIDSQANSSKVLLGDYPRIPADETILRAILQRKPLPIRKTGIKNLDIVPSHILLSNTDIELTTAIDHREARLKNALAGIRKAYRHIIIDCPPTLSWLTINALTAAERVLVVVSPGYFELDSIVQISKTIKEVQEYFNPDLQILGFLFTISDPTINAATSLQILRQSYREYVLKTVIPRNVAIREAHMNKLDIFTYDPKAKSALAYRKLIKEIYAI